MNDDYPMTRECPQCHGPAIFEGMINGEECYRCRDCGLVFDTNDILEGEYDDE